MDEAEVLFARYGPTLLTALPNSITMPESNERHSIEPGSKRYPRPEVNSMPDTQTPFRQSETASDMDMPESDVQSCLADRESPPSVLSDDELPHAVEQHSNGCGNKTRTVTHFSPPALNPLALHPVQASDLETMDEGFVEDLRSPASSLTTIDSAIYHGVWENGRQYPNYGRLPYGLPVDEHEQNRLNRQHKMYLQLTGKHHLAPIDTCPQRILDLCTGTGIWAIEMADAYPCAQVIGTDVIPIQPEMLPPNCSMEIDDIETPWCRKDNDFDLIHLRDPLFVVRDWPELVSRAHKHLRPGGWFELAGTYLRPVHADGSALKDSPFLNTCQVILDASRCFGTPTDYPLHFATHLRQAGFINVVQQVFNIPCAPVPETEDEHTRNVALLETENLGACASSLGQRVLRQAFDWTDAQISQRMSVFRKAYSQYRSDVVFQQ